MSGMSRIAARRRAAEGGISIGALRSLIKAAREEDLSLIPSRVNKIFSKEESLEILERALGDRRDDEIPKVWRRDSFRNGRSMATVDQLLIRNILWECGPLPGGPP